MKSKHIVEISQIDIDYVVGGEGGTELDTCSFVQVKKELCSSGAGELLYKLGGWVIAAGLGAATGFVLVTYEFKANKRAI